MRQKLRWLSGMLCMAVVLFVACQPPAAPKTLNQDYQELGKIDAQGGTLCSTGGVCFSFPADAVTQGISVQAKKENGTDDTVGPVYDFKAEVETFAKSIEITLPVPAGEEQSDLAVAFYKDGAWQEVSTRATADGKARIGTTDHFSQWSLRRRCQPKPEQCDGKDNDCDGKVDNGAQLCGKGKVCKKGKCEPMCDCQSDADCASNPSQQMLCVNCSCQAVPTCSQGKTACQTPRGTLCVDLLTDTTNCGACGQACTRSQTCQRGSCVSGPTQCSTDADCKNNEACVRGTCQATQICPPDKTACQNPAGTTCIDLRSDTSNCGACGKACASGQTCQRGICTQGPTTCVSDADCPRGLICTQRICTQGPTTCVADADCKANEACVNGTCQVQSVCKVGDRRACYTGPAGSEGVGTCQAGVQACQNGRWSNCIGEVLPQKEACDGKDNDCNGQVDEGCNNTCTSDADCKATEVCISGTCQASCTPSPEICDRLDNDCDGMVDENCTCPRGQSACQNPAGTQCVDLTTDNNNCGSCGNVCVRNQTCQAGVCR